MLLIQHYTERQLLRWSFHVNKKIWLVLVELQASSEVGRK